MDTTDAMVNFHSLLKCFSLKVSIIFSIFIHMSFILLHVWLISKPAHCQDAAVSNCLSLSGLDGHLAAGTMYSGRGAVSEGIAYSLQRR